MILRIHTCLLHMKEDALMYENPHFHPGSAVIQSRLGGLGRNADLPHGWEIADPDWKCRSAKHHAWSGNEINITEWKHRSKTPISSPVMTLGQKVWSSE